MLRVRSCTSIDAQTYVVYIDRCSDVRSCSIAAPPPVVDDDAERQRADRVQQRPTQGQIELGVFKQCNVVCQTHKVNGFPTIIVGEGKSDAEHKRHKEKDTEQNAAGAQNAQNAPVCFSDDFFFIFIPPLFSLAGIPAPGLFDVLSIALQKTQIPPLFCLLTPKCIAFLARFW